MANEEGVPDARLWRLLGHYALRSQGDLQHAGHEPEVRAEVGGAILIIEQTNLIR